MLSVKFDASALDRTFEGMTGAIEAAIRPAAAAGAKVFYDEVKLRAAKNDKGTGSGRLAASIYRLYVPEVSVEGKRATYYISWRKGTSKQANADRKAGKAGLPTAFHGQLIEYGYWQRYVMAKDESGKFIGPAKQPGWEKMRKPRKGDSQAYKDSYWVPLPDPIYHAPRSFLRSSYEAKKAEAIAAVQNELYTRIANAFV